LTQDSFNRGFENNKTKKMKAVYITDHKCDEPLKLCSIDTEIKNLKQLHVRSNVSRWLYLIYVERKIFLTASLEQNHENLIKSNQLYRPIRSFAYSLLLNANLKFNVGEKIHVDEIEYNSAKGEKVTTRVNIQSVDIRYLNFNLDQIWCKKCTTTGKRISLILDCLNICESKHDLIGKYGEAYEKKYFIPCSILRYILKSGKILTHNDIKSFLCTFVSHNLGCDHEVYIKNLTVSWIWLFLGNNKDVVVLA
jgi:hypothetical protein